ncbi:MAG TPA: hypothetical protein VMU72_09870 [Gaiellaceae bacterium]|nr:hypothetical protein [Gaiellaceae bacterium]
MRRLALIAAAGIVLVGCGTSHKSSPTSRSHYPVVVHLPRIEAKPPGVRMSGFVQFISPTRLAITTGGSSSCPSVPDELVVISRHVIRIHLIPGSWINRVPVAQAPPGGACTADYGTTPMVLTIDPKLVDVHRPLTVRFFYNDSKKPLVRTAAPLKR